MIVYPSLQFVIFDFEMKRKRRERKILREVYKKSGDK